MNERNHDVLCGVSHSWSVFQMNNMSGIGILKQRVASLVLAQGRALVFWISYELGRNREELRRLLKERLDPVASEIQSQLQSQSWRNQDSHRGSCLGNTVSVKFGPEFKELNPRIIVVIASVETSK